MKQLLSYFGELGETDNRQSSTIRLLVEVMADQKLGERAALLTSFELRIEALSGLYGHPWFRAWTLAPEEPGGARLIHEAVIEAAAIQPLIEVDHRPAFDPVSFFARVLDRTRSQGAA